MRLKRRTSPLVARLQDGGIGIAIRVVSRDLPTFSHSFMVSGAEVLFDAIYLFGVFNSVAPEEIQLKNEKVCHR
jgi:hypothetical protein